MFYSRRWGPVVFLLLAEAGCHVRPVAVPSPPPPTAGSQPAPAPPAPATATGSAETASPNGPGAAEPAPYQVNKPAPAPPATAAKKPARPAPAPSAAPASPSIAPSTPAPKLGDVLSADEIRQYSAAIDLSLSHAQGSLRAIENRQLTKDQQGEVAQIRNFMQQAEASRSSDPAGAKSLAQRAEVLARDLAATFH